MSYATDIHDGPDHFFQDVCVCPCSECLARSKDKVRCTCIGCDIRKCGLSTFKEVKVT